MVGVVLSDGTIRVVAVATQGPQGIPGPEGGGGGVYTNLTPVPVTLGGIEAGSTFDDTPITDVLDQLLYPYQEPLANLGVVPNNNLREYGDDVLSVLLTANTTARTYPITNITFKRGAIVLQSGLLTTYNELNDILVPTTFSVEVDDGSGEPAVPVISSRAFNFVYPFYWGVGAPGLTIAQVAALTKDISVKSTKDVTTSPASEVYYFAYPSAYGPLSDILDDNSFSTISDYTYRQDESYTGLDGTPQDYDVYEFDILTFQTDFTNTFIF
jgi:hypothetical protein